MNPSHKVSKYATNKARNTTFDMKKKKVVRYSDEDDSDLQQRKGNLSYDGGGIIRDLSRVRIKQYDKERREKELPPPMRINRYENEPRENEFPSAIKIKQDESDQKEKKYEAPRVIVPPKRIRVLHHPNGQSYSHPGKMRIQSAGMPFRMRGIKRAREYKLIESTIEGTYKN